MKITCGLMVGVSAFLVCAASARTVSSQDGTWSFVRDDAGVLDASPEAFDDTAWEKVEVPHDWAIGSAFDPKLPGDTGSLPWEGVGWYRRTFELSAADWAVLNNGGKAELRFDGVMASPRVFVNGVSAGGWDYGYLGFTLDVTALVREGRNQLTVRADTRNHKSRWYPGGGIYRSCRLVVLPREHVIDGETFVTTPLATAERATVRVAFALAGASVADLAVTAPDGTTVAKLRGVSPVEFDVARPALWDLGRGNLYTCRIRVGEDEQVTRFGIRSIKADGRRGLVVNGRREQLRGVNLHADLGPLGMAFNRSAAKRQLEIMRDMGANALRTSHNCPDPYVLDLCDEMGLLVWDECFDKWNGTAGRRDNEDVDDYVMRNLRAFVKRDRNHPCVFVWSIGNEIWTDTDTWEMGHGMKPPRVKAFRDAIREVDATRLVGAGCCYTNAIGNGTLEALDIVGFNYQEQYKFVHQRYPLKAVAYSESASAFSGGGYFGNPPAKDRCAYATNGVIEVDAYDHCAAAWSDIPDFEFYRMERDRYCVGEFVWTGIDYLGEPSPFVSKGARSSYFGICDLMGFPKDRYWLYRAHWNTAAETCHILPHWNWEGTGATNVPVYVYTSGDSAELFLNGRSLGRRAKKQKVTVNEMRRGLGVNCIEADDFRENPYYDVCDKYRLRWLDVPYEPGELKAVCYRGKKKIGEAVVRTAGAAAAVKLTPEATALPVDGETVVFVKVEAVDAAGVKCPKDMRRVSFALTGPGEIVSVGNADPRGLDSFKATGSHPLYYGTACVVLRRQKGAVGEIVLTASAEGLAPGRCAF